MGPRRVLLLGGRQWNAEKRWAEPLRLVLKGRRRDFWEEQGLYDCIMREMGFSCMAIGTDIVEKLQRYLQEGRYHPSIG